MADVSEKKVRAMRGEGKKGAQQRNSGRENIVFPDQVMLRKGSGSAFVHTTLSLCEQRTRRCGCGLLYRVSVEEWFVFSIALSTVSLGRQAKMTPVWLLTVKTVWIWQVVKEGRRALGALEVRRTSSGYRGCCWSRGKETGEHNLFPVALRRRQVALTR